MEDWIGWPYHIRIVIDDEINPDADSPLDGHRNPIPLPNLECNIVCGNSLIDQFEGIPLINHSDIIGTNEGAQQNLFQSTYDAILPSLLKAQDDLFYCQNTDTKQELKDTIEALKDELVKSQMCMASREAWEEYLRARKQASRPFVLWDENHEGMGICPVCYRLGFERELPCSEKILSQM